MDLKINEFFTHQQPILMQMMISAHKNDVELQKKGIDGQRR